MLRASTCGILMKILVLICWYSYAIIILEIYWVFRICLLRLTQITYIYNLNKLYYDVLLMMLIMLIVTNDGA